MNDESDGHLLRRWVSVGDVLVLVTSLLAIGITYGRLAAIVGQLQREVSEMHDQDLTPGARAQLAELRTLVVTNSAQIAVIRQETREGRAEVLNAVHQVDNKLDRHMDRTQR